MATFAATNKPDREAVKITILQTDIRWASPKANQEAAGELIMGAEPSDLYVLPEMWDIGFGMAAGEITKLGNDRGSLEWMVGIARARGCAISGSTVATTRDGGLRNRHYFVLPDGTWRHYDKRHLFAIGGEGCFSAGNERVVVEYGGMRFLLQTCYDLRFPVWQRNRGDYDVMLLAANWPASRNRVWQVLLRARAIENQCYVVAANRVGNDPMCSYMGRSAVIDAKGRTVAHARGSREQALTADIDMGSLEDFRSRFPVLDDRDREPTDHDHIINSKE